MKVTVDTNILVRAVVCDDPEQGGVAAKLLTDAELIAVALPCLCEFVRVLRRVYGFQPANAVAAIHALLATANVEANRPAVEAGLSVLEAGGDFADGVIAYEGNWLGGETVMSFDNRAVALLARDRADALRLTTARSHFHPFADRKTVEGFWQRADKRRRPPRPAYHDVHAPSMSATVLASP